MPAAAAARPAEDHRQPRPRGTQCRMSETQGTPVPTVGECQRKIGDIKVDRWGPTYEAGRVSQSVQEWAKITSDANILRDLRSLKLNFIEIPTQDRPLPEFRFSQREREKVRGEIETLVSKKVLVPVEYMAGKFISNIFLREKKEKGKYRMILNPKHLNKFTEKKHFKMGTLITTLSLVGPGCTFLSFDFTDAYYACSMANFPISQFKKFRWYCELILLTLTDVL